MTSSLATALTETTDPYVLSDNDAADVLVGAPWRRFAVVGDSLAAGTGDPEPGYEHLPWAARVARILRGVDPRAAYLNTGEIGATTAKTLEMQAGSVVDFRPDLVHIASGANDIWRRSKPSYDRIETDLDRLFGIAAGLHAQVTTFTLIRTFVAPGIDDFPQRVERLNAITRSVARDHGALVIDTWDHPITSRTNVMSADGVHLNASGQAMLATEMVRGLAALLAGDR
ncbi:SGNH/GDSL hydrolase family protein [Luteipulveratus mongoliensis]|uniref:SGNH hydrolase-type esterase domain-containing protein n=1 Tax=Luteipulveratus mongoliensis TaxID=571913 RepID=A0A0K1JEE9_9MICO|nr:SGNH/GDSL hydrolase family protein [Luteipulveratus mongoliensis]AKU15079.1 hypothetical protein VV02_03065 [Luteipulveratus mongoliensis]